MNNPELNKIILCLQASLDQLKGSTRESRDDLLRIYKHGLQYEVDKNFCRLVCGTLLFEMLTRDIELEDYDYLFSIADQLEMPPELSELAEQADQDL